jgi:hypothetical protein
MKIYKYILLVAVACLTACNLDISQDEKQYAFGFIEQRNSDIVLTDDINQTYLLNNIKYDDSIVDKRYYIEGITPAGVQNKNYNYVVNVTYSSLVKIFEPQPMPAQEELNTLWDGVMSLSERRIIQTGKYLNVSIEYYGDKLESHIFAYFVDNEIDEVSNTIKVHLNHNPNNDTNKNPSIGIIVTSLDITTLFNRFSTDFNITLVYNDYQTPQKELTIRILNLNK